MRGREWIRDRDHMAVRREPTMTLPDQGEGEAIELSARDRDRSVAALSRGNAGSKDALRRAAERFMEDVVDPAVARAPAPEVTRSESQGGSNASGKGAKTRFTDSDLLL